MVVAVACSHFSLSFSYFRCQTHRGRERERERETEWTAWFLCRRCSRRRRTEAAEQLPWNEALKKVTDRATVVRSEADEGRGRGNEFVAQHVDFKCRQGKLDLTLASVL